YTPSYALQYVFVRHGKDLHLDIKKSVKLDKKTDLFWKCNKTNNVAKYGFNIDPVVFDKYEGRAELFGQNYSLVLKNVQHNDSGDYTALVVGTSFKSLYVCYSSDPVSPVNLTVDSVSGSSESCVLAVNCSTVDSSIHHSFRCDDKNCSQVKEKTFKPQNYSSSFTVYLQQDFILCNHSNQVSWEYSKIKFDCKTITGKYKTTLIQISTSAGLFLLSVFIALCIVTKCKSQCVFKQQQQ
uniref:Immunoglobulin subtype domain-containing protein n=1 Tax=Oreochromis aureus TaxID=47969 RepID=A0A668VYA0_OREAU